MVLGHAARQLFGDGNAGAAGVTPAQEYVRKVITICICAGIKGNVTVTTHVQQATR